MKTLQVELPDELARDVETAVNNGTFRDAAEVVCAALREFISTRRFELLEQQQLDDVAWIEGARGQSQLRVDDRALLVGPSEPAPIHSPV